MRPSRTIVPIVLLFCLETLPITVKAETGEPEDTVSTLTATIGRLEKKYDGDILDLQSQIYRLEEEIAETRRRAGSVASQRQRANVFNPSITAFGNFLMRLDDKRVYLDQGHEHGHAEEEGPVAIDDQFNLREVELDFRGAVDPWADGVVITTFHSEFPGDVHVEIEEGYFTLKRLPGVDKAPLGLKLRAGKFRAEAGRLNRIHTHDMPWMTRPISHTTYLGGEGFMQNGISARLFVPTPGDNNTLEATAQVMNDGGLPYSPDEPAGKGGWLGNLKWFWEVAPGHDVDIGGTAYAENPNTGGGLDLRLYTADFTYKWKPFREGEWRSFLLGGEFYAADMPKEAGRDDLPVGYFVWSQYQFSRRWYLGLRYDRTEPIEAMEEENEDEHEQISKIQSLGGYLTYYTTEFLRFRLGYEHVGEEIGESNNLNTVYFEMNFVFGSHPIEPYWVNR